MPIFVYRFHDDDTETEQLFSSWRDAPQETVIGGRTARKVPATFSSHFTDYHLRGLAKEGIVPTEAGMDRDARRNKRLQAERADANRREAIAQAMAQIAT